MTNIFFVKGDILITTPIEKSGIEGILRQVVYRKTKSSSKKLSSLKLIKKHSKTLIKCF